MLRVNALCYTIMLAIFYSSWAFKHLNVFVCRSFLTLRPRRSSSKRTVNFFLTHSFMGAEYYILYNVFFFLFLIFKWKILKNLSWKMCQKIIIWLIVKTIIEQEFSYLFIPVCVFCMYVKRTGTCLNSCKASLFSFKKLLKGSEKNWQI